MSAARRDGLLLALVLLVGLVLRGLDWNEPWSGVPQDFRSAFGGGSTGGPARNFVTWGFTEAGFVPFATRFETADGGLVHDYYPHHPTTCISITALSMTLFGSSEAASRFPWVLASMLVLVGTWRLARMLWDGPVALVAALLAAVMPLAAHFASMLWIDGLIVWLHLCLLRRYVLWIRSGAGRHLALAALYAFLGGLCDWSSAFLFPGLGLHALVVFGRARDGRRLLATAVLPAALFAAFGLHGLHLRAMLPPDYVSRDTRDTLEWVTSLPVPLGEFLALQRDYLARYVTWPLLLLSVAGAVLAARDAARSAVGRAGERAPEAGRGVLVALALSGPLYVAVFPGRSVNHWFFVGLSVPFFAIASALVLVRLARAVRETGSSGRAAAAAGALCAAGLVASLVAWRYPTPELSWSAPRTWPVLPLVAARFLPAAAFAGAAVALARGARRTLAAAALAGALGGAAALAAWDDVRLWHLRGDDRIGRLVAEPWMREALDDPRAMIATTATITMPLQFYAKGPVWLGVYSNEALDALSERVFARMADGYRVLFLYDAGSHLRDARQGTLDPGTAAQLAALRERLLATGEPETWDGLEVYDLTELARGARGARGDGDR